MRAALDEIHVLLSEYEAYYLASYVSELLDLQVEDEHVFREAVRSDEIWGGAGSLIDLNLVALAPARQSAAADNQRLQQAILRLGKALESARLSDERVSELTRMVERQTRRET